jgi:hypothetical protein
LNQKDTKRERQTAHPPPPKKKASLAIKERQSVVYRYVKSRKFDPTQEDRVQGTKEKVH